MNHRPWYDELAILIVTCGVFFGGAYVIAQLPRYAQEQVAWAGVIAFILFFIWAQLHGAD